MDEATGAPRMPRRQFLIGAGGAAAAAWIGLNWPSIAAAHGHAVAARADGDAAFTVLSAAAARDVEAIAAQIVPTDDMPGAREAGAVHFIDRSFATWLAPDARRYLDGLDDFWREFAKFGGGATAFADAPGAQQIAFLKSVENTPFFGGTRMLTLLGMFALPEYGGNRGGVGWKLLGFEDQHAFQPPFGWYDRDYPGWRPVEKQR
jgi:gluconate 2-dehydrogenase gamma chain